MYNVCMYVCMYMFWSLSLSCQNGMDPSPMSVCLLSQCVCICMCMCIWYIVLYVYVKPLSLSPQKCGGLQVAEGGGDPHAVMDIFAFITTMAHTHTTHTHTQGDRTTRIGTR